MLSAASLRPLNMLRLILAALYLLPFSATALRGQNADTYQVVHTYPHDAQAFTQGLVFLDGHLYESTGIEGKSSLRVEDVETGGISQLQDVPGKYFAEGLTNWDSTLIQLTWQNHVILVYDRATLRFLHSAAYSGD